MPEPTSLGQGIPPEPSSLGRGAPEQPSASCFTTGPREQPSTSCYNRAALQTWLSLSLSLSYSLSLTLSLLSLSHSLTRALMTVCVQRGSSHKNKAHASCLTTRSRARCTGRHKDTGRTGRRDRGRRDPRSLEGHGTDMEEPSLRPGHKRLVAKKTPTTSAPGSRIAVAEGSHNFEADETKSRALGGVSAVAPLLALGVDVHPSGRLCRIQANHPSNTTQAAACCDW